MAHQVIVRPPPPRRHRRRGVGELAGGMAAECAAVCCCCPCAVVNLVVLVVYKVPKGLVTKAAHKRRRRLTKKNKNIDNYSVVLGNMQNDVVLLNPQRSSTSFGFSMTPALFREILEKEKEEVEGLEKEMWARFAGTGFWRSESQRQP